MITLERLKKYKPQDKIVILILSFFITFIVGMMTGNIISDYQLTKIFMKYSENQKSLNINKNTNK